jgi:hypothetical protein
MPPLQIKARTAETYLAGIGASGALMASAFVMFVILVGIVTFDAWPRAAHLIGGGDGQVSLNTAPSRTVVTPVPQTPNLAKLLGHPAPAGSVLQVSPSNAGPSKPARTHGSLSGGTSPGPSGGGQAPVENPEPPAPPPTQTGTSVVRGAVSTVGNSAEGTTNFVGDAVGGNSGPGVGGLVGDLGRTVNGAVQGLVGNSN